MGGMDRVRSVCTPRRGRWLGVSRRSGRRRGVRADGSAEAEAAARRREDFQSEARPGFIESVVTVYPVEG